ncbi:MAG: glycosyltransferase [Planctomycetota bacterium]
MPSLPSYLKPRTLVLGLRDVYKSCQEVGVRGTWTRIRGRLKRGRVDPKTLYENNHRSQEEYFRAYFRAPLKTRRKALEDLLHAERGYRAVILYPASYRLELRQRPEHVLRAFAADGYLCLMLTIGGDAPIVRRHGPRLYATNLFEDALAYFRNTRVVLYLSFPGYRYLSSLMPRAILIYDVLDRMEIFANYCSAMGRDHAALRSAADLVMCSAPPLYEETAPGTKRCLLVPNGVYAEDFAATVAPPSPPPVVVGYYGAITELLDFDLLDAIADIEEVRLALAGPVTAFKPDRAIEVQTRVDALLARRNVRHHGVLAYEDLSGFLAETHCAIVPFIVNSETDAVSPLKLFEYLAADKPVLATPTANVKQFTREIFVGAREAIVERIRSGRWREVDRQGASELVQRHSWTALLRPVKAVLDELQPAASRSTVELTEKPKVDIININFFDWNGETVYKGGAERYVHDLAKLCERMGCSVRILQNANFDFVRRFRDIEVIGLPLVKQLDFPALSKGFAEHTREADLVIASPLELACRFFPTRKVIGINHGIHWDARTTRIETFSTRIFDLIQESLQRCDECVCVDTNFINWVRSFEWRMAQHLHFLPNYVDLAEFRPVAKNFGDSRLTVLYPRRLYDPRGFHETLDAFAFLMQSTDSLDLHLCGQATGADADRARRAIAMHPERIRWYELPMEQMPEAYAKSHIVLVPTMYAEGTSLSCIEAMATNNAVITTNVGGLPNLVLDGFNGLVIRPDTWDLVAALKRLVGDRDLTARLARNASGVAQSLGKERWEQSWARVIESVLPLPARPAQQRQTIEAAV